MSKKKKPFRQSHTRKLRDGSAAFFDKYDNSVFHLSHWRLDVTVSNYLLAV